MINKCGNFVVYVISVVYDNFTASISCILGLSTYNAPHSARIWVKLLPETMLFSRRSRAFLLCPHSWLHALVLGAYQTPATCHTVKTR